MPIHFVNRFYWPDEPATAQLLTDLASGLAARGHAVSVIASRSGKPRPMDGAPAHLVRIHSVATTRWGRRSVPGRIADLGTFYLGACWQLLRRVRRGDVVVALTDPPLIGVAAWLIARWRGAGIVHWVQDIYPEIAMELSGQRWLAVLRPARDLAWRRSDGCITLGDAMARVIAKAGVAPGRIHVSPNWAPAGLERVNSTSVEELRTRWNLTGKFVVAYSGNLGRVHDLDPVLDVAAELRAEPEVAIVMVGDGARRPALEAAARARNLTNVHFHPSQPRPLLSTTLALPDVHLVTLRPGCESCVFPSKLYGAAALGRPVIFIGPADSDPARVISQEKIGAAFTRDQSRGIADQIRHWHAHPGERDLLAGNARRFAAVQQADALAFWDSLLRAGLAGPASVR